MGENRFCTSCGAKLDEKAKFCGECGQAVWQDSETKTVTIKRKPKKQKKKGGCGVAILLGLFVAFILFLPDSGGEYDGEDVFGSDDSNIQTDTSGSSGQGADNNDDTGQNSGPDHGGSIGNDVNTADNGSASGSGSSAGSDTNISSVVNNDIAEYTFMVFMNGTDLESGGGNGTLDLREMANVGSTDEVNIIVETCGTQYWQNNTVDGSQNQRFRVVKDDIELVESVGLKNIGDPDTLYDFIVWSVENYPAQRYVLDLWNHGGGPLYGYGADEHFTIADGEYEYPEYLTLEEIETALRRATEDTGIRFEVLGFDACLMATVEVGFMAGPYADYLVASEEEEPGHGWDYEGIMKGLTGNPYMDGRALGQVICDTYEAHAIANGNESMITLSVVDLGYINDVVLALEDLSVEFMMNMSDVNTFNTISYGRNTAESYGRNNPFSGYTELIDLYDFARNIEGDQAYRAEALMKAIDLAVVYKVQGPERNFSGGLSIFFPYMDKDNLEYNLSEYRDINPLDMYETFLQEFVWAQNNDTRSVVFESREPEQVDEGIYSIVISEEDAYNIASIYNYLGVILNEEMTVVLSLGMDTNVNYDPETGIVSDNFTGYWTGLNGQIVNLNVVEDTYEYNLYNIPAYVNGQRCDIVGKWTWDDTYEDGGYYSVLGAWAVTEEGEVMAEKDFFAIKIGDTIDPIYEVLDSDTYEKQEITDEPFILEEEPYLGFIELPTDEIYLYGFYIVDYAQNGDFSGFEMFEYVD